MFRRRIEDRRWLKLVERVLYRIKVWIYNRSGVVTKPICTVMNKNVYVCMYICMYNVCRLNNERGMNCQAGWL